MSSDASDFEAQETILIEAGAHIGMRLDAFLAKRFEGDYSRSHLQRMVKDGHVTVNAKPVKPNHKLRDHDRLDISVLPVEGYEAKPEDIPIEIVHEDEHLLCVNKPAPMVVYPSPGHKTGVLVNAVLNHVPDLPAIGGEDRPGIVHRLDKDTSGVMLLAKTEAAYHGLVAMFKAREMQKHYLAITAATPDPSEGSIEAPLLASPRDRKKIIVHTDGKSALTHYRVAGANARGALVEAFPKTGRTHQIRVHLQHIGCSIVADPFYSRHSQFFASSCSFTKEKDETPVLTRHALHAYAIEFSHPITQQPMRFSAPVPDDMVSALDALELSNHLKSL